MSDLQPDLCIRCNEPILPGEANWIVRDMHDECAIRSAAGSLAHLQMRCSCVVPGAIETDPPELTQREAAKAVKNWVNIHGVVPRPMQS